MWCIFDFISATNCRLFADEAQCIAIRASKGSQAFVSGYISLIAQLYALRSISGRCADYSVSYIIRNAGFAFFA